MIRTCPQKKEPSTMPSLTQDGHCSVAGDFPQPLVEHTRAIAANLRDMSDKGVEIGAQRFIGE